MLADISSTVYAAIGSRDWWDQWGELAAWGVVIGVAAEFATEFDFLAKLIGIAARPELRKRIEKLGLLLLVAALVAEVLVGRMSKKQTEIIESTLTHSLRDTIAANAGLSRKIDIEKTDITADETSLNTLTGGETALGTALNGDGRKIASINTELSWRHVNSTQVAALERSLKSKPIEVIISSVNLNSESQMYAVSLARALQKTDAKAAIGFPRDAFSMGLYVMQSDDPATKMLERALCAAKVPFGLGGTENGSPNQALLFVGTKPHGKWPPVDCASVRP